MPQIDYSEMEQGDKKITITEVARLSGVSKGTVDRVLHDRGEVSQRSKQKVLEVIEQLGYKPNIYASMLASKKRYNIICLIPRHQSGEYWGLIYRGIKSTIDWANGYNVSIEIVDYDQFDIDSFREACANVLSSEPSAVILAPMFKDDTIMLSSELNSRNIPYVYIDSRLEGSNYLAYYGMPMYQSGYLCASLLGSEQEIDQIANFRIDRGNTTQSDPTLRRREGFTAYITEHHPQCKIYNTFIHPTDEIVNMRILDKFFEEHPKVKYIVTFNSRVHLIAEYLERREIKDRTLLGFDMLERNVKGLQKGYVSILIAQRTETQVVKGVNAIIEYLILKKSPSARDNFMSMDILTKYNVNYYSDNHEL